MVSDEFLAREILGHGAYLCLSPARPADRAALRKAPVEALAARLAFENEWSAPARPQSIAFLRRVAAEPREIDDPGVRDAAAVVHVAARAAAPVEAFCAELPGLLPPGTAVRVLRGVAQPKNYTGAAMNNWAYARAVAQQPGPAMPCAFLLPMSKTEAWWRKDWMERHTYFLPRYGDDGRMVAEGHALAAAAGIEVIMRRTYRAPESPAPAGGYDFVTYFECADAHVPVFDAVCAALRDVRRNPEWAFVREGPTWRGRRVAAWADLFADEVP